MAGAMSQMLAAPSTYWNKDPKPIPHEGIVAGEIIAWRGWKVNHDLQLTSIFKDQHIWQPGVPMTGDVRHEYGVHAFKDPSCVRDYCRDDLGHSSHNYLRNTPKPTTLAYAAGKVALWGEVVEHAWGYRAEFAKIISIEDVMCLAQVEKSRLLTDLRAKYVR